MTEKQLYDMLRTAATNAMANNKDLGLEYHNSDHVTHALLTHETLFSQTSISSSINLCQKLAILYHDVVYIPDGRYNEDNSARFFTWQLRRVLGNNEYVLGYDEYLNAERGIEPEQDDSMVQCALFVPGWIQSTTLAHHLSTLPYGRSIDILLDCDLASMAKPYPSFKMQQFSIIEEAHPGMDSAQHQQNALVRHASFLKNFYGKLRIYRTEEAQAALEDQARTNIRTFIDEFKG